MLLRSATPALRQGLSAQMEQMDMLARTREILAQLVA
jgi:hypothetical protein